MRQREKGEGAHAKKTQSDSEGEIIIISLPDELKKIESSLCEVIKVDEIR